MASLIVRIQSIWHAEGNAEGKTCVDCQYGIGIACEEPDGPDLQELFANK